MPVFKNRLVAEVARGLTAFLSLETGLVRGPAPSSDQASQTRRLGERVKKQEQEIKRLRGRLSNANRRNTKADGATSHQTHAGSTDRLELLRGLLAPMKPGRLLDLGCGHGKFSLLARDLGWEVTAVDARTVRMPRNSGITWVHSDVREFEIEEYECICVLGLFYHLELKDQIELLRKCAGTTMILDTHVSLEPVHKEKGYEGHLFEEAPGTTPEQHAEKATASWANKQSFWPTEESQIRMIYDAGFSSVYKLEPYYMPDRTFFLCH